MNEMPILLVEDNSDDEFLMIRALRKRALANEIDVARDGAEAVELLVGKSARNYCLVLLDLHLPKIPGLEVLQQMRLHERTRTTPVVVLTSSSEDRDLKTAYLSGANSYIRKPVDFKEFVEVVAHLGMYWLVINCPCPPVWSASSSDWQKELS